MIKIDASAIGIKTPVRVNETIHNVKKSFEFQKDMVKTSKPEGKTQVDKIVHYYDSQVKAIGLIVDYISTVLGLTNKQVKRLNETAFPKIEALSRQIVTKMLHYTDDAAQQSGKK